MEVQGSEVQLQKSAQRSEDVHLAQQAHAKLRDVQAVRGGVLWEPAGLKTGSAAGAFFR